MTAKWPFPFVLVFGLTITRAADPTVTIDTASPSGKLSPLFYRVDDGGDQPRLRWRPLR